MKKMIFALMAMLLMSTSFAQTKKVAQLNTIETTEISGDIALLYNSSFDPTGLKGFVQIYVDGYLFGEKFVRFSSNGLASIRIKKGGQLLPGNRNFEVKVTVMGYTHSNTGILQHAVGFDYEDNYTFGTAIGCVPLK